MTCKKAGHPDQPRLVDARQLQWGRFLGAKTDEDRAAAAKESKVISDTHETFMDMAADPAARREAERRWESKYFYDMDMQMCREEGEARGEARGRAAAVLSLLTARGIRLSGQALERVRTCSDVQLLDGWLLRAATMRPDADMFVE